MVIYANATHIVVARFNGESVEGTKFFKHFKSDIHDLRSDPVAG
jgi:hypothetical protein